MSLRRLAVSAAVVVVLVACGPDDNPGGNSGSDGDNPATTSDLYN